VGHAREAIGEWRRALARGGGGATGGGLAPARGRLGRGGSGLGRRKRARGWVGAVDWVGGVDWCSRYCQHGWVTGHPAAADVWRAGVHGGKPSRVGGVGAACSCGARAGGAVGDEGLYTVGESYGSWVPVTNAGEGMVSQWGTAVGPWASGDVEDRWGAGERGRGRKGAGSEGGGKWDSAGRMWGRERWRRATRGAGGEGGEVR